MDSVSQQRRPNALEFDADGFTQALQKQIQNTPLSDAQIEQVRRIVHEELLRIATPSTDFTPAIHVIVGENTPDDESDAE